MRLGGVTVDPEEIRELELFRKEKEKPIKEQVYKIIITNELTVEQAKYILYNILHRIEDVGLNTVIKDGMIED